jgi:hypothetical protein
VWLVYALGYSHQKGKHEVFGLGASSLTLTLVRVHTPLAGYPPLRKNNPLSLKLLHTPCADDVLHTRSISDRCLILSRYKTNSAIDRMGQNLCRM